MFARADYTRPEHHVFHEVARVLAGAEAIRVLGPSVTKLHFLKYLQKHDPALGSRIVDLETADHPSDRQIVAHVRGHFHSSPPRPRAWAREQRGPGRFALTANPGRNIVAGSLPPGTHAASSGGLVVAGQGI